MVVLLRARPDQLDLQVQRGTKFSLLAGLIQETFRLGTKTFLSLLNLRDSKTCIGVLLDPPIEGPPNKEGPSVVPWQWL